MTINQAVGQADPTNTSPINFTVVFSEAVTGFATGDVTSAAPRAGPRPARSRGGPTTYTVAVTGMTTSGTVIATIARRRRHRPRGQRQRRLDLGRQHRHLGQRRPDRHDQPGGRPGSIPTNASPINFTVVFSEAVAGFATGDVTLTGTAGGTLTGTVTGGPATYNVAVTGMTTPGTVIATHRRRRRHRPAPATPTPPRPRPTTPSPGTTSRRP